MKEGPPQKINNVETPPAEQAGTIPDGTTTNKSEQTLEARQTFLQDFSKTHHSAERHATAKKVFSSRQEKRAVQERKIQMEETANSLNELRDKLDEYDSFYKKLTDFKTYSKLQSQLKEKQSDLAKIRAEQIPNNFREPAEIIGRFNERMAKEWKETPYNKEEAVKYLVISGKRNQNRSIRIT